MAAFKKDEYDSDMSDEVLEEEPLSAWLDEEEPEEDPNAKPKPVIVVSPKIDIVRKPKYIIDNLDLFYALCEVDDWGFVDLTDQQQEDIMKALTIRSYQPGENIIVEGDGGNDCYIVSATEETAHFAEVEVVTGNILEGTEVFLTRLQRGQYFGQKYFLTRRAVSLQPALVFSCHVLSPKYVIFPPLLITAKARRHRASAQGRQGGRERGRALAGALRQVGQLPQPAAGQDGADGADAAAQGEAENPAEPVHQGLQRRGLYHPPGRCW